MSNESVLNLAEKLIEEKEDKKIKKEKRIEVVKVLTAAESSSGSEDGEEGGQFDEEDEDMEDGDYNHEEQEEDEEEAEEDDEDYKPGNSSNSSSRKMKLKKEEAAAADDDASPLVEFNYGATNKGNKSVWYSGFRYTFNGRGIWRCCNKNCGASVRHLRECEDGKVMGKLGKQGHTHLPDPLRREMELKRAEIRQRLRENPQQKNGKLFSDLAFNFHIGPNEKGALRQFMKREREKLIGKQKKIVNKNADEEEEEEEEEQVERTLVEFQEGATSKGNKSLWFSGFRYLHGRRHIWRCSIRVCKATATNVKESEEDGVIRGFLGKKRHNHPPFPETRELELRRNAIRVRVRENPNQKPSKMLDEFKAVINDPEYFEKTDSALRRFIIRQKAKLRGSSTGGVAVDDGSQSFDNADNTANFVTVGGGGGLDLDHDDDEPMHLDLANNNDNGHHQQILAQLYGQEQRQNGQQKQQIGHQQLHEQRQPHSQPPLQQQQLFGGRRQNVVNVVVGGGATHQQQHGGRSGDHRYMHHHQQQNDGPSSSSSQQSRQTLVQQQQRQQQQPLEMEAMNGQLFVELMRQFYDKEWMLGSSGGMAAVVAPEGHLLVSPSGVPKERLTQAELFLYDRTALLQQQLQPSGTLAAGPSNNLINNQHHHHNNHVGNFIIGAPIVVPQPLLGPVHLRPSACTPLFLLLLRSSPGAQCAIHTHSKWATLVTTRMAGRDRLEIRNQEMLKGVLNRANGWLPMRYRDRLMVPIIENEDTEQELLPAMQTALTNFPHAAAILVRHHGLFVWGPSWQKTKVMLECVEYLLGLAWEMGRAGMDIGMPPFA